MFKLSLIIAGTILFGYYFRKGLRRGWYAFWTEEETPDFEALEKKWWGDEK